MKIYVVFGTTGEYSDRTEWPVKAFVNEESAQDLVLKAGDFARAVEAKREGALSALPNESKNPFDPDMRIDYTGTSYYYIPVELEE